MLIINFPPLNLIKTFFTKLHQPPPPPDGRIPDACRSHPHPPHHVHLIRFSILLPSTLRSSNDFIPSTFRPKLCCVSHCVDQVLRHPHLVLFPCRERPTKSRVAKMCFLAYTDTPDMFVTPHHAGRSVALDYTEAIRDHCSAIVSWSCRLPFYFAHTRAWRRHTHTHIKTVLT
jgi:hypothetical protein